MRHAPEAPCHKPEPAPSPLPRAGDFLSTSLSEACAVSTERGVQPLHVLSPERVLQLGTHTLKAGTKNVHPEQLAIENYLRPEGIEFPRRELVWSLRPGECLRTAKLPAVLLEKLAYAHSLARAKRLRSVECS